MAKAQLIGYWQDPEGCSSTALALYSDGSVCMRTNLGWVDVALVPGPGEDVAAAAASVARGYGLAAAPLHVVRHADGVRYWEGRTWTDVPTEARVYMDPAELEWDLRYLRSPDPDEDGDAPEPQPCEAVRIDGAR